LIIRLGVTVCVYSESQELHDVDAAMAQDFCLAYSLPVLPIKPPSGHCAKK